MEHSRIVYTAAALLACAALFSCRTVPQREERHISRSITGAAVLSAEELADFFVRSNPAAGADTALRMARYYVAEAADEGINSDVAFAQMCLETGFLKFGGLVTLDMHNYCGLGSLDAAHPGETFPTEQMGVRAHIQHLNAYGDTDELSHPLIDRRYRYVKPRGKAPTIFELAGTWAADPDYGAKLDGILSRMEGG